MQSFVWDFDTNMPQELKEIVYATEACREYLLLRKRLGALAEQQFKAGGSLSHGYIVGESAKLDTLGIALQRVIDALRGDMH